MTHFRTYCIGEYDVDELYEKFCEQTEVPEYSRGAVPEEELIRFVEHFTKPDNHGIVSHPRAKKLVEDYEMADETKRGELFKKIMEKAFEPLYKEYGETWNWNRWRKDENGVWTEYSTYNPNTVFDYFSEEDETTLGELENPIETLCNSCGIFKDNNYTDFEEVGWWGYSADTDKRQYDTAIVRSLLEGLPPETPIYRFDCHI